MHRSSSGFALLRKLVLPAWRDWTESVCRWALWLPYDKPRKPGVFFVRCLMHQGRSKPSICSASSRRAVAILADSLSLRRSCWQAGQYSVCEAEAGGLDWGCWVSAETIRPPQHGQFILSFLEKRQLFRVIRTLPIAKRKKQPSCDGCFFKHPLLVLLVGRGKPNNPRYPGQRGRCCIRFPAYPTSINLHQTSQRKFDPLIATGHVSGVSERQNSY